MSDELTPDEIAQIEQSILDGVTYTIEFDPEHTVKAIRWQQNMLGKPAAPNAVVESVVEHVGPEGMPLFIDGQEYFIKKITGD